MRFTKIHEILEKAQQAPDDKERANILVANNCLGLRDVLRAAYDDTIVFTLPEGIPPYTSNVSKEGISPTNLIRNTTQFTYFVKRGEGDKIPQFKRESVFVRLLEGIDPKDAEVLCAVKEKRLQAQYSKVTKELVQKIWPKLILK